jgi:fatty acid desaturase
VTYFLRTRQVLGGARQFSREQPARHRRRSRATTRPPWGNPATRSIWLRHVVPGRALKIGEAPPPATRSKSVRHVDSLTHSGERLYLCSVERPVPASGSIAFSATLIIGALTVLCFQLVVLPIWLLPIDAAWGWLMVPMALLANPFWSVIHEAIHGLLLNDRKWNDRFGRMLAIGYGTPFAVLKTGHLLHHRYNRTLHEEIRYDIYDPLTACWSAAAPKHYLRLLVGVYLAAISIVLLVAAPRRLWHHLARRRGAPVRVSGMVLERISRSQLRQFRLDAVAVILVYGGASFAYGRNVWMLAAVIVVRALLISMVDNAYHYGTRLDTTLEALNLRLPRSLEYFLLSFNLHGVHHRHPGLPWRELHRQFDHDHEQFDLGWFVAVGRQFRGPISCQREDVRPMPQDVTTMAAFTSKASPAS